MRSGGAELLAGVTIDPTFGPVLAVGPGGIWVEILEDTSLRMLPVDPAEVKRMLGELRGLPRLQGARGTQAANLDAAAEAIAGLGSAALSLNGALRAMEVNPLYVNGDQVGTLDVLVVTGDRRRHRPGGLDPGRRAAGACRARPSPRPTGGIGFTWEHDAHLYFRRAKPSQLFLGDGNYHGTTWPPGSACRPLLAAAQLAWGVAAPTVCAIRRRSLLVGRRSWNPSLMPSFPATFAEDVIDLPARAQFEAFLDEHRCGLGRCLDGLTEEQARRSLVPSRTTLLGLVKHATFVEKVWFDEAVTGRSRAEIGIPANSDESFVLCDDDTIASVRRAHREACESSRRATSSLGLDDTVYGYRRGPLPLRWVCLHVLRELAQHCGHADILREQILNG